VRVKLNGIVVDYALDSREGAPVLALLHGFPFNRHFWKGQVADLKGQFQVLTYDLRGMGQTDLGRPPQPLEAYVDDLFALLDHLKLPKVALAGLSMGGYIALRAVQREPQRFWALALCDTRADADSDEGKLKRAAGIKAIREKGAEAYSRAMLPNLLAPSSPAAPGLLKIMLSAKADGMANALSAMAGRSDTSAVLPGLTVPTLVLAGAEDKLIPGAVAEEMAAKIPGAKLTILAGAGHASNLDKPDDFNRELAQFLKAAQ
jgi:3-oxoadipate enol-lactonase